MVVAGFIPVGFIVGPFELGIILLIILMLFGAGRLPQVMQQLGQAVGVLRRATRIGDDEDA